MHMPAYDGDAPCKPTWSWFHGENQRQSRDRNRVWEPSCAHARYGQCRPTDTGLWSTPCAPPKGPWSRTCDGPVRDARAVCSVTTKWSPNPRRISIGDGDARDIDGRGARGPPQPITVFQTPHIREHRSNSAGCAVLQTAVLQPRAPSPKDGPQFFSPMAPSQWPKAKWLKCESPPACAPRPRPRQRVAPQ